MGLQIRLFLIVILLATASCNVLRRRTHCRAEPKQVVEKVELSCFFPEDLQETQHSYCVRRVDKTNGEAEIVVSCTWKDGLRDCYTKEGYEQDAVDGFEVHVQATNETAGTRFTCNIVPPNKDTVFQECEVPLPEADNLKSQGLDPTPKTTSSTEKTEDVNAAAESPTNTEEKDATSDKVVIVIGALFTVSLAANVFVLLLVVYKRRMASNNGKPMKTPKHQPQGRRHIFWVCLSSCSKSNSHLRDGEQGETVCVDMEKDNVSTEHALANGRGITANHTSQPFLPNA